MTKVKGALIRKPEWLRGLWITWRRLPERGNLLIFIQANQTLTE